MGNANTVKTLKFNESQLSDIYSNHRLMVLDLRGYNEKLATHEQVQKHIVGIQKVISEAGVRLELSGDPMRDALKINDVLNAALAEAAPARRYSA